MNKSITQNILIKIRHSPLIITKIFEYTFERPFILHELINKSKNLREKLEKFTILKINNLSKEDNYLFSLFYNSFNFDKIFTDTMTKKIDIDYEEQNYYVTKPYLNTLYEENIQPLFNEYKIFLRNHSNIFYTKALIEYFTNKSIITLSINFFTKENNNNFNFDFTESDLDINYIKYLIQNEKRDVLQKQKFRLIINMYNRYYNFSNKNNLNKNIYCTNNDLIKKLKIEEIYFIRPSFYKNNIEKVYNEKCMIEELELLFNFLKNLEYPEELTSIYFSENIIKNIDLFNNEILNLLAIEDKKSNINIIFNNLKYIGINLNLMNKKIKDFIYIIFSYILSFIEYEDLVNNKNLIDINDNKKDNIMITEGTLSINLEKNNIYNQSIFNNLYKLFNKNSSYINKILKLVIVYEYDSFDVNKIKEYIIENFINIYCFLPYLNNIVINNISNKKSNLIVYNSSKIFNIISFLCYNSPQLSSIKLKDTILPYNILDIFQNNLPFINNLTNLEINSPSLCYYDYRTIIEKINKCINLKNVLIDTTSSKFHDSFEKCKISKNLKNLQQFSFNNFFIYTNNKNKEIKFIQNSSIDKELINLFSEIIENENNLDTFIINGFHYNFDEIKNKNVENILINLEENDKDYKINQIKFKKINLKLNNFPNLKNLYVYVDILYEIDNFIQMPICKNLQRIFLFASVINCNIDKLDFILKKNNVELIVRNIESFNKCKILAYISTFPMMHNNL